MHMSCHATATATAVTSSVVYHRVCPVMPCPPPNPTPLPTPQQAYASILNSELASDLGNFHDHLPPHHDRALSPLHKTWVSSTHTGALEMDQPSPSTTPRAKRGISMTGVPMIDDASSSPRIGPSRRSTTGMGAGGKSWRGSVEVRGREECGGGSARTPCPCPTCMHGPCAVSAAASFCGL